MCLRRGYGRARFRAGRTMQAVPCDHLLWCPDQGVRVSPVPCVWMNLVTYGDSTCSMHTCPGLVAFLET